MTQHNPERRNTMADTNRTNRDHAQASLIRRHISPAEARVGDTVGFKADVEQYGVITEITRVGFFGDDRLFTLSGNFQGEYIGGLTQTEVYENDCFDCTTTREEG